MARLVEIAGIQPGHELKVKTCPFCGFGPILSVDMDEPSRFVFVVYCGNCQARGPLSEAPEKAADRWNRRADL
jgi:Lar family restriction alleviation protein